MIQEVQCAICISLLSGPPFETEGQIEDVWVIKNCGHVFHQWCLISLPSTSQNKRRCPSCRTEFDIYADCREIFLEFVNVQLGAAFNHIQNQRDQLRNERDEIKSERDQLRSDRDQLREENIRIVSELNLAKDNLKCLEAQLQDIIKRRRTASTTKEFRAQQRWEFPDSTCLNCESSTHSSFECPHPPLIRTFVRTTFRKWGPVQTLYSAFPATGCKYSAGHIIRKFIQFTRHDFNRYDIQAIFSYFFFNRACFKCGLSMHENHHCPLEHRKSDNWFLKQVFFLCNPQKAEKEKRYREFLEFKFGNLFNEVWKTIPDTEFPGIVVRPQCAVRSTGGMFPYELLKSNQLKIIQLGVTFMDKNGKTPEGICTWQFNFKFNLKKDLFAPDSISLLTRCGIQFEKHEKMGIEPEMFGEYFMSSGMVTSDQVTYLTFHSGFDFGYLIKLLSNLPLPDNEEKFFEFMRIYFPNVYDLKFLMKSVDLHGGLQDIANQMGQQRVGTQHQAGSDSLLTGMTFFKILEDVFNGEIDDVKYAGKLYGFHMTAEDGRDEGWSEISGDILDPTSPKPPPPASSRNILPGSVVLPLPLPHHSIIASSTNLNGDSGR